MRETNIASDRSATGSPRRLLPAQPAKSVCRLPQLAFGRGVPGLRITLRRKCGPALPDLRDWFAARFGGRRILHRSLYKVHSTATSP